jgi:hypothetical protein
VTGPTAKETLSTVAAMSGGMTGPLPKLTSGLSKCLQKYKLLALACGNLPSVPMTGARTYLSRRKHNMLQTDALHLVFLATFLNILYHFHIFCPIQTVKKQLSVTRNS